MRFEYVMKVSTSLRDTRYIHDRCLVRAPVDCREHDVNKLRSFMVVHELDRTVFEQLEALDAFLNPHPGSGSGGA